MENVMITKLTGHAAVASSHALALRGARLGLGAAGLCPVVGSDVSGPVQTWADLRDERPTKAPIADLAAVRHGGYAEVIGAGEHKQQDEQIKRATARFTAATAVRMRAYRGPEPWRERP